MEQARMENVRRMEAFIEPEKYGEKNDFRPYDQNQVFYVTVSKKSLMEKTLPASIIDYAVERLDLTEHYDQYVDEGNPLIILKRC